jgi:peptidoglycan/LPS O-acetylase OafA/YrhL
LDVLRGVAVVTVLVVHTPWPVRPGEGVWGRLLALGTYGVDLFFFVLSGFLISGLLFAEYAKSGSIRFGRYWLRRGFKIWPSYFATYGLAFTLAYASRVQAGEPTLGLLMRSLPNFVFVQNYLSTDSRWFASWSLAVEEQFCTTLTPLLFGLLACP